MDQTALLSANYSQLGPLLIGQESVFTPTFWNKSNIHVVDEVSVYTPVRDGASFGQTVRFVQPKRATLACDYLLEVTLSSSEPLNAGYLPGPPPTGGTAAYVNNLGDQILAQVTHRYANNILHQYDGEYQQLYQRLSVNEVNEEGRNALTLGGLPLTAGNNVPELQRQAALINGFTLYCPLNRLWFAQHLDEAWMPEAYATEGEVEIEFARLEDIVYNAAAGSPDPFAGGTRPTITSVRLIAREATLTVPEKMSRLSYYETDRGMMTHFLDVERQRRVTLQGTATGGNREFRIRLDNIRLDMQEIFFIIRRGEGVGVPNTQAAIDRDWSGDNLQGPVYDFSTLPAAPAPINSTIGATRIDTIVDDVVGYRLEANGKRIADNQSELVGRAWARKLYHSDSQPRTSLHQLSFSLYPDDTKNVTGFQNAANLGNLELVVELPDFPVDQPRILDLWCHSHNVIQSRRGDVVKTLK